MKLYKEPEFVPVLSKNDMWKGSFSSPSGDRHCLAEWVNKVFHQNDKHFIRIKLLKIAKKLTKMDDYLAIAPINDKCSYKQNAEIWNKTMRDIGYTEIVDY